MSREEAIKALIEFTSAVFDLYGEEPETNLYERSVGNEFEEEMKKYKEQGEKLESIIKVIEE